MKKMINIKPLQEITFPKSQFLKINMMPFIIGEKESLPTEYWHYLQLIKECPIEKEEIGKVGYLTIHESIVKQGSTQRRAGIHTDGHCCKNSDKRAWGGGGSGKALGDGTLHVQGIYMASNINMMTRAWDFKVDNSGWMGDCESCPEIMAILPKIDPIYMQGNRLYWINDQCPHEALPAKVDCNRQFFRLVTSAVDIWYTRHSTPNPLGIKAPCKHIDENKFQ